MNDPRIPITSARRVQSKTAPALTEPMEAHLSESRTPELLTAEMNEYPERMLPVDTHLVARIISLVGHIDVDLNTRLSAEDEKIRAARGPMNQSYRWFISRQDRVQFMMLF